MPFSKLLARLSKRRETRSFNRIYEKYKPYTMIDRFTYLTNLGLVKTAAALPGCVVECGVWRGGMIAGMAEVLGAERDYYLFDSFEGLPPATEIDGPAALAWQADRTSPTYYGNCMAPRQMAEQAMSVSPARSVHLLPGWFNETLSSFRPSHPIAVLRLDADWYESTMTCLTLLVPNMAQGGLIIVDDYYTWDGCARAVHEYVATNLGSEFGSFKIAFAILRFRDLVPQREIGEATLSLLKWLLIETTPDSRYHNGKVSSAQGIIVNFRAAFVGGPLNWPALGYPALAAKLARLLGSFYFRRAERSFANIV